MACAAVHIVTGDIAEIKSVAVQPTAQGNGFGRRIIEACLEEAATLGLQRVFCLTYQEEFFKALGFRRVDRSRLPEKSLGRMRAL